MLIDNIASVIYNVERFPNPHMKIEKSVLVNAIALVIAVFGLTSCGDRYCFVPSQPVMVVQIPSDWLVVNGQPAPPFHPPQRPELRAGWYQDANPPRMLVGRGYVYVQAFRPPPRVIVIRRHH